MVSIYSGWQGYTVAGRSRRWKKQANAFHCRPALKEGITSRAEISELEQNANYYRQKYFDCANALERMKTKYNELKEKCGPFLQALEHFPEVAKLFTEKVKQLFSFKEAQERAEKEAREKERQERIKARRSKRGMER